MNRHIFIMLPITALFLTGLGSEAAHAQFNPLDPHAVKVDDDPGRSRQYKETEPASIEHCKPNRMFASCGRVFWEGAEMPKLHTEYMAIVPSLLRMDGPKDDVLFAPFISCMTFSVRDGRLLSSGQGPICKTILRKPDQRMDWAIGGFAQGMENAPPGEYTAKIPFTLKEDNGATWDTVVPIKWNRMPRLSECTIEGPPDINLGKVFVDEMFTIFEDDLPITITAPSGREEALMVNMKCTEGDCALLGLFGKDVLTVGKPAETPVDAHNSTYVFPGKIEAEGVPGISTAGIYTATVTITSNCPS